VQSKPRRRFLAKRTSKVPRNFAGPGLEPRLFVVCVVEVNADNVVFLAEDKPDAKPTTAACFLHDLIKRAPSGWVVVVNSVISVG
jgi:hypothetical protein